MFHLVKAIVEFLIDPLQLIFLTLILCAVAHYRKWYVWRRWLLISTAVIFTITSTDIIPNALINTLENDFAPLKNVKGLETKKVNVLVLGAGHADDPALTQVNQLTAEALARLTEGIRIFNDLDSALLVFSGYSVHSVIPHYKIMQSAAIDLGVLQTSTEVLAAATSTEEEAHAYVDKFGNRGSLILVTSAFHMKRAMKIFQGVGLDPIPAPTNFMIKRYPGAVWDLLGYGNFYKVQVSLHEYIGLMYYWMRHG